MSRTKLVGLLVLWVGLPGCATVARQFGEHATMGAQEAMRAEKEQRQPEEQALDDALTRRESEQMARGLVDAFTRPESPFQPPASGGGPLVDAAGSSSSSLASEVARGLSTELGRQLGPDGTGPLGQSLSATAGRIASSMVQQSRDELGSLFPECGGLQGEQARACRDAQLASLGASFTRGATQGLVQAVRPWLLVFTFTGGLLVGLLVFLSISMVRANRESSRREVLFRQQRRPV
ncbi:hypothetical protein [Melittangium boletus]|uniref:Lipoprotein n=1 Tax=Melittangium boletus DSM 14713 TaxID=1294270 RepID=A0A250IIU1_9BACT|nr:hypothetical protein [Melittangium boletus]ATB30846.1 hypothetical protein MEBOL_004308 [Melittangium boletus DSM 14713]